jgi:hypothetical protein
MLRMIRTSGCTFPLSHLGAAHLSRDIKKEEPKIGTYLRRGVWEIRYSCLKEICRADIRKHVHHLRLKFHSRTLSDTLAR